MKTLALLIGILASSASAQIIPVPPGGGNSYNGVLLNQNGIALSTAVTMDLAAFSASKVSAQVNSGTTTFTSPTFQDGSESTGSVKVISVTGLSSATATNQITIGTTAFTTSVVLTIGNNTLTMGQQFLRATTSSGTAKNIAAAISLLPNLSASASASVVYATATYGSYANSIAFVSNNSSVTVATALMSGGSDNALLTIGTKTLTQGVDWVAGASTTTAVLSLGNAIANAGLKLSTNAIGALGVIVASSTLNGAVYNYALVSSTPTALSVFNPVMVGGITPTVLLSTPAAAVFTSPSASGLTTGLAVLYSSTSLATIGGLLTGTTYYAVPINATQFELANCSSCAAPALLKDLVVVTSTNSQVGAHTYTLVPLALTGTASYTWQGSNDNANWNSLYVTSLPSGSITAATLNVTATANSSWDFGFYNYRYMRLSVVGPTTGGILVNANVNIKQDGIGRW